MIFFFIFALVFFAEVLVFYDNLSWNLSYYMTKIVFEILLYFLSRSFIFKFSVVSLLN